MSTILPRDPALPQLALALHPRVMALVFGAATNGLQVRTCAVDRVKYRPGRNCTVSYLLRLRDPQCGYDFDQRVAARFCSGGDSARRRLKTAGRATVASAAGPAVQHLATLDMLAHWLPNDAKLDALQVLQDDAGLRIRCLDEVVAALTGGRGRLIDQHSALVQYIPETRVCAQVKLRLQCEPGAPVTTHTLYAKADGERSGAATHATMQTLYHSPAQASGRLRTPRPVLWQKAAGLHWQLALRGLPLLDADPKVGPTSSARVGAQLAALHATPVPVSRMAQAETLRRQPHQVGRLLSQVEPAWEPLLARLVRRLDAGAGGLAREAAVTLHGDLHPRNILVDGASHAFIDLDDVQLGPAAIELGAWVADALYRAVLDGDAPRQVAPSWRAFLQAYAGAGGCAVDAPLLAWSTAHNLLCQRAYRCVANLKPGRFEAVPALLALADSIAGAGTVDAATDFEFEPA